MTIGQNATGGIEICPAIPGCYASAIDGLMASPSQSRRASRVMGSASNSGWFSTALMQAALPPISVSVKSIP